MSEWVCVNLREKDWERKKEGERGRKREWGSRRERRRERRRDGEREWKRERDEVLFVKPNLWGVKPHLSTHLLSRKSIR
jgi:hypothetical protein